MYIITAGETAYMKAWNMYIELTEQNIEPPKYLSPSIYVPTPASDGNMSPLVLEKTKPVLKIAIPKVIKSVSFGSVSTVEISPRDVTDENEAKGEIEPETPKF
jgi:hypothetical protein